MRRLASLAVVLLCLGGCDSVIMTAGGIAGSIGLDYYMQDDKGRVLNAPAGEVQKAARHTLDRMAITVEKEGPRTGEGQRGWEIMATAYGRTIRVDVIPMTPRTTRLVVVAYRQLEILRDEGTSEEIIFQTARQIGPARAMETARR